ncbi:kinase [Lecanosticta acicola]|uniref:Kinase n=1 Tax=Lecanosticta acicola TaxID=111012 RepID=A0AAI9E8F1_9PEZI|nr:kinase [Lecanosticta acicola]
MNIGTLDIHHDASRACPQECLDVPRTFPSDGFKLLDSLEKVEEEDWDWYSAEAYYPVRIGDTFQSRYQIVGKLGYGAHSTAWLSRDLHAHRFVALKACERGSPSAERELAAYQQLESLTTEYLGALVIRQLLDSFTIRAFGHEYRCMVHEPLGMSVEILQHLMPNQQLSEDALSSKMVHTDLQASNIHFRVGDDSIFDDFAEAEMDNPIPRKVDGDRVIYESRGLKMPKKTGPPVLCDFGEARLGRSSYTDDIQPYVYRAPEVILDIPWSYEVDIWNVGVMIWDLFEGRHLFRARGPNGARSSEYHLAEMVAILGLPPAEYLRRTPTSRKYFDDHGAWKAAAVVPETSLETIETRLSGDNKAAFLAFVRKMLLWCPERRYTARQLLDDSWLNS